ncbi:MAG: hypothetical protein J5982_05660 [Bacilli bacterium]|nr:hypothetical protein [Bacilli bacterium]
MNIINRFKKLNNKGRVLLIGSVSFIILLVSTIVFNFTFSLNSVNTFNGIKLNDVVIEDIKLSDINIVESDGITKYIANVSTKKEQNINYVRILFKDENNKTIVSLIGYVGTSLTTKDTKIINASTDADLSEVKSIEYEIVG